MKNYKRDFPIFQKNPSLVYLDSAATSQKPNVVLYAMQAYYETYNSNVRRGLYPIAEKATEKVEEVRRQVAKFINAKDPSEIIFVRNTTEAINLVAYSMSYNINEGDSVVATIMEHHSNFVPWQQLAKSKNCNFEVLDFGENFQFSIFNFQSNPKIKDAKILAISQVSNVLGTINSIKEIIKEVRKQNPDIFVLVDAAQSIPHMKVDVQDLDCDFLAFSGHKMFASTGIGVLYGKRKILEETQPFLYGGNMISEVSVQNTTFADIPAKFEAGTPDIAGVVSLGAAIEYINSAGIENIQKQDNEIMSYSLLNMEKIKGLEILGPTDPTERSSVIAFTMEGIHPHDIAQILGDSNICIRAGHHCTMPLHNRLGISVTARVSFYLYNDTQDIDRFIDGLKKAERMFKGKL